MWPFTKQFPYRYSAYDSDYDRKHKFTDQPFTIMQLNKIAYIHTGSWSLPRFSSWANAEPQRESLFPCTWSFLHSLLIYTHRTIYEANLFNCWLTQIANQPITWQQPLDEKQNFRHCRFVPVSRRRVPCRPWHIQAEPARNIPPLWQWWGLEKGACRQHGVVERRCYLISIWIAVKIG